MQLAGRRDKYVLTSGTMSDGRDFSFFKKENGIARLSKHLVSECSTASPFDYQKHTRMYIPEDMPAPDNSSEDYIDAITERILRLIDATNGHTAILFTSYKVLQAVYERAIQQLGKYEVFCMTRNNRKVITDFRKSKNGVLFASGSMWEGVDCVGDGLSSVIIVRLPFPLRTATMEQRKETVGDVAKFVHEYAVPEMFNRAQEELSKRKARSPQSQKTAITASGKYSKYALTDVLICAECGSRYKRVTWTSLGQKRIVWRCVNRLDNGKKYCQHSPTLSEAALQEAIVRALNKFNDEDTST